MARFVFHLLPMIKQIIVAKFGLRARYEEEERGPTPTGLVFYRKRSTLVCQRDFFIKIFILFDLCQWEFN